MNLFTDENAVFESRKFPSLAMGVKKKTGQLTSKTSTDLKTRQLQHFRLIGGLCGIPGTVSFESVAQPGFFLYANNRMVMLFSHGFVVGSKGQARTCFYPRYDKYYDVRKLN